MREQNIIEKLVELFFNLCVFLVPKWLKFKILYSLDDAAFMKRLDLGLNPEEISIDDIYAVLREK